MNRQEATQAILEAKRSKSISFEEIAHAVGRHKVWTTAALFGQATMTPEESERAVECLVLGQDVAEALQQIPLKGSLDEPVPVDPLIYRFYEIVNVYGTTFKELIHEEFGDGIMSAIDFDMTLERQPDQKGDRVKIGMSGKFLGYKTY